jgi:hypothetical protein
VKRLDRLECPCGKAAYKIGKNTHWRDSEEQLETQLRFTLGQMIVKCIDCGTSARDFRAVYLEPS